MKKSHNYCNYSEQRTVKLAGLPESSSFVCLMGLALLRAETRRTESEATR